MATKKKIKPQKTWVIKSTESTCSEAERRLMALISGAEPLNESEVRMKQEIDEIHRRGHMVEIPFM